MNAMINPVPTHYCHNCKDTFSDPVYITERDNIDYGIGTRWVTLFEGWVCPFCESDRIEDYDPEEEDEEVRDENAGNP